MASIERRPNGSYRARWREYPGGPQKAKHFTYKRDAQAFLDDLRVQLSTGGYVDPTAGSELFRTYAERWFENRVARPRTIEKVRSVLDVHLLPAFGDRQLRAIRRSDVQAFISRLAQTRAPATVEVVHTYLAMILRDAVRDQLLTRSPCHDIERPKVAKKRVEVVSMADVACLAEALPARYRAMPWLAVGSGLRLSEILGLTVDRVDFLRRTITVDRQLTSSKGRPTELASPKTPASHRVIPVASETTELLAAHLASHPPGEWGLIFSNERGGPLRLNSAEAIFLEARKTSKVTATFHALRHTYASILIHAGASVKVVQERMGHQSAALTLDVYSHLFDDQHDATRDMISAALQAAQSSPAALRIADDEG